MSEENVEMVRSALEAINRGDWAGTLRNAAPDFEYDQTRGVGLNPRIFNRAEWQGLAEEFADSWESVIYQADEFIDAGEHVVTPFTNRLRGRDGIEVQARGVWLWAFNDGVLARVTLYQERHEALKAAGLSD
jgi:ketosteroid isomerase-like protein